jgi:DNA polymerase-1
MPAPKSAKSAAKAAAQPAPKKTATPALVGALKQGDHVFLVDGSSYIFRAYHALPPLNRKSDGLQVNAVLGFCNMLWKLLRDMKPEDKPTHLAVVFDKSEKTFRTDFYPDYKAHRPAAPADLIPQFPLIREAVHAFDIPCLEQAGYEADDLIATYARLACEAGASATIVSSDKDLMQLVTDCVIMYDTMKDKKIGVAEVIEKFGVPPEKVIEVQSLIGDSTDNVPGVPGIGVKTAAQLIGEYGDLETLLSRAAEIKQEKRRQTLIDNAELARISRQLVTLDQHVDLDVPVEDLAVHEPDYRKLIAFCKALEFTTLTRRIAEAAEIDAGQIEADGRLSAGAPPLAPVRPEDGAPLPSPPPLRGRSTAEGGREGGQRQADLFGSAPPPNPPPQGGRERSGASCLHPRLARRGAACEAESAAVRPLEIRDRARSRAPEGVDRARHRCRSGRDRHPDQFARSDAGRFVRLLAGADAERGLLRPGRASQHRRRRGAVRRGSRAASDFRERRHRGDEAAVRGHRRAQDRAQPEIRLADFRAARDFRRAL